MNLRKKLAIIKSYIYKNKSIYVDIINYRLKTFKSFNVIFSQWKKICYGLIKLTIAELTIDFVKKSNFFINK